MFLGMRTLDCRVDYVLEVLMAFILAAELTSIKNTILMVFFNGCCFQNKTYLKISFVLEVVFELADVCSLESNQLHASYFMIYSLLIGQVYIWNLYIVFVTGALMTSNWIETIRELYTYCYFNPVWGDPVWDHEHKRQAARLEPSKI